MNVEFASSLQRPDALVRKAERSGKLAVLEPDNRNGSMAPLILAAICAVFGAEFLAFFTNASFGK